MRLALAMLLLAAAVQADQLPKPTTTGEMSEPKFMEQVGYSIGLNLGRRLRADGIELDLAAVVAGVKDGITDAEPMLDDKQIEAVMARFNKQMQQKAEAEMSDAAQVNQARGEKFLKENAGKEGIKSTDSGLQYRVIEAGEGASPGPADTVKCHYEGTLIGGEVFDSSYKRDEPATFPVGGVIAGWTEALQQMKVGAKWEVFLPADIAYGPRGAGGAIGPNETLIFTIELLEIAK